MSQLITVGQANEQGCTLWIIQGPGHEAYPSPRLMLSALKKFSSLESVNWNPELGF
ncbi:hypothetical protein PAXRUDRAFT_836005 [Paxillus rubicundulus Ve08.2h10]|uniref:Uncharacterized protein n=1 Tax=Paxillus rubicundulus Ve08.2h10 TaxID=930991 RepID=A0A0D0CG97_9AGAM|nr:hypothetical protein PAXRUDRAFT_836005 [Paxillus rubicundulus Ve08.2h10]